MKEVKFNMIISRICEVEICAPSGMGKELFHLYVDKRYHGAIFKRGDEWATGLPANTKLTGDDLKVIIDMIEHYFNT